MANTAFSEVQVAGIACAVPENLVDNRGPSEHLTAEEVQEFVSQTGVLQHYVASDKQTTSDLCFCAAEALMKHKGYAPEDIDAIIFITQTPDYFQPATAHVLHKRLNMPKSCFVFDVNLGCSGYTYGLYLASTLIHGGGVRRVLLACGEVSRKNNCYGTKNKMLFGDAGTATILEATSAEDSTAHPGVRCLLESDGAGYDILIIGGGQCRQQYHPGDRSYDELTCTFMDGESVMSFSITEVPRAFRKFFNLYGTSPADYDYFALHQANLFMLNYIARKVKIPKEKMPIAMDRYGNTSSASIPLAIVDLCERESVPDRMRMITSGFGIGLSWGVVSFELDRKDVLPMIRTDDYFREAYFA